MQQVTKVLLLQTNKAKHLYYQNNCYETGQFLITHSNNTFGETFSCTKASSKTLHYIHHFTEPHKSRRHVTKNVLVAVFHVMVFYTGSQHHSTVTSSDSRKSLSAYAMFCFKIVTTCMAKL
jgi:hypothetical protein